MSHVYKTYPGPIHALKNVDLNIEKGEFVFITGPSGAGKTTLFRLISAYDRPTSGMISVAGFPVGQLKSSEVAHLRRKVGVVYQDFKLLKDYTVFENVLLPLQILGWSHGDSLRRVESILEQVGLLAKRDNLPHQLSGGEQQRVSIARAIVHQPGVLIADEPTGNLDPSLAEDIMDLLEKVNSQGTTVFVATHDHELVKARRKRVLQIKEGQLMAGIA